MNAVIKINKDVSLHNFINLLDKERKMVLEWRNNDSIRKWMLNKEKISYKNHNQFIKNLKNQKDSLYYLLKRNKEDIGVIYFKRSKQFTSLGIYSNPNTFGNGKILMESLCYHAFENLNVKTLIADVFDNNYPAINLYSKYNFKIKNNEKYYQKNLLRMELKNEDWKI